MNEFEYARMMEEEAMMDAMDAKEDCEVKDE